MEDNSLQHMFMVHGAVIAIAALGTLIVSLLGRWVGGVWTTLLGVTAAMLLAAPRLLDEPLFIRLATDREQRLLVALIPFTLILIGLSFKAVPALVRIAFAVIAPPCLLCWVFHHYLPDVPLTTVFKQIILPVCIAMLIGWGLVEPIARRSPGVAAPMVVGFFSAGCSLLFVPRELQAFFMASMVPATAGAAVIAAVISRLLGKSLPLARGCVLLWMMILAAQFTYLWIAHSTSEMPLKYLSWLATVPLLAWIPETKPIHRLQPWKRESIRFVLLAIPVILTAIPVIKAARAEEDDDESGISRVESPHPAAPILPSQMPIPNTINPPTIT